MCVWRGAGRYLRDGLPARIFSTTNAKNNVEKKCVG